MSGLVVSLAVALGIQKARQERATNPAALSKRSWKRALGCVKDSINIHNLGMLAAGIAYGGTLAFFPLIVASVAITSLVLDADQIREIVGHFETFLPQDITGLLSAQLTNALDNQTTNIVVAIVAIGIALFGVSGAMNSMVRGLNVAYDEKETRHIVKVRLLSLALTAGMIVGMLIVLPLLVLGGSVLRDWGLPHEVVTAFSILRWAILAAVMAGGLSILYRYAPNRANPQWQWVSWGASVATLLWLAVTALFFIYVQDFSSFSESYSLFAGIIVLMIWLNLSSLIILLGAEINHHLERQTTANTQT